MSNIQHPPLLETVVNSVRDLTITRAWRGYLQAIADRVNVAAQAVRSAAITLTGQNASIALSNLIPLATGLYRINWRIRVTTAAGVSSSIQVTVTSTDGTIAVNQSGPAYVGNATNAPQSGVILAKCDASTPLSYSTTYASNPAGAMQYEIEVRTESL